MAGEQREANRLLIEMREGHRDAETRLPALLSEELRKVIGWYLRGEPRPRLGFGGALAQVVHLRLAGEDTPWQDRAHFLAVGAQALRRILVDHARAGAGSEQGAAIPSLDQPLRLSAIEPRQLIRLDGGLRRLAE